MLYANITVGMPANILNIPVFNALSIGNGPAKAVLNQHLDYVNYTSAL